jgi:hypothetical protein
VVVNVDVLPFSACGAEWLAKEWSTLESQTEASFFCSWTWVGSWLAEISDHSALWIYQVRDAEETVALGVFGRAPRPVAAVWLPRTLQLHETGRPLEDALTIEHNGLLVRDGRAGAVWAAVLAQLATQPAIWHRLRISGIADPAQCEALAQAASAQGLVYLHRYARPYYWVDLEKIRRSAGGYLDTLSRNTRYQIRRACKALGGEENLGVTVAQSPAEAKTAFDALKRLHDEYWHGKGIPGAFASDFARRFHERLIERALEHRQLQLLTVAAGDEVLGHLYNFVNAGRVVTYQSGFNYAGDNKAKPGMVAHALAIQYNVEAGEDVYDFLMGDSQYKRSLAERSGEMAWIEVRRPLMRFHVEDALRSSKSRLRQWMSAWHRPDDS